MWDTYLAFSILVATIIFGRRFFQNSSPNTSLRLAFAAFIGLEADVLFRIFLLVPGGTYQYFYGLDVEELKIIWISGAIFTPLKAALSTFATVVIGKTVVDYLKPRIMFDP